jgi:ribosome-associated protein
VSDDLQVAPDLIIPAGELHWTFSTSGGPGGQHANRSATRAELRFDLGGSPTVHDQVRERMLERLGVRAAGGVVAVVVDETRSQWQNRQLARRRLQELLREAFRRPVVRRPTRPSATARARRLEEKRHRSRVKRLRKPPQDW